MQKKIFAGALLSFFLFVFFPTNTNAYIVENGEINKEISDEGVTFTYNELEEVIILANEEEGTGTVDTGGSSGGGGGRYDASNWLLQQKYDELVALRDDDWEPTHAAPPLEYDPDDLETILVTSVDTEAPLGSPEVIEKPFVSSPEEAPETTDTPLLSYDTAGSLKSDVLNIDNIQPDWVNRFFMPVELSFFDTEEADDTERCVFLTENNLKVLEYQIGAIYELIRVFILLLFFLFFLQLITFFILKRQCQYLKEVRVKTTTKKGKRKNFWFLLALVLIPIMSTQVAHANTFDTEKVYYQGILKDDLGNRLTGSYDFRFSVWLSQDFISGEVVAGEIVTTAPQYLDWQEAQTKNIVNGDFLFRIGEVLTLPTDLFVDHYVYLQVEVKETAQANTEYEIIDIDGADPTKDRLKFFDPVPYARNTDTLDFHAAGYTADDIPYLDANGKLPEDIVYSKTKENTFTLDSAGVAVATDILSLVFGETLGKTISWNGLTDQFEFNDSVAISGDLLVLGTINGVSVGTKDITDTLSPMYDKSVFTPDGTNNIGSMYEEDENQKNIIRWTTEEAGLQDYDLQVRYTLPTDFEEFAGTDDISLALKTDGTVGESKIDVSLKKEGDGATEQLTGSTTAISSNTWTTQDFSLNPATTWAAGDVMIFKIKLYASDTNDAHIGDLKINYTIN